MKSFKNNLIYTVFKFILIWEITAVCYWNIHADTIESFTFY